MRATVTVVTLGRTSQLRREDVSIDAPAATPVGEVVHALARLVAAGHEDSPADPGAPAPLCAPSAFVNGVALEPMLPLGASPLRHGAVVTIGGPPAGQAASRRAARGMGCLQLRVVGGPSAGGVHPLPFGVTEIGRGGRCGVRLDDPDVSRRHALITLAEHGVTVCDAGSTNGTTIDGVPVGKEPVAMAPGSLLRLGESTLATAPPSEAPVALTPMGDGRLAHNRPPRLDSPDADAPGPAIAFPEPPPDRPPARLPLIATVAPLVAGVALAAVMRRPEYLLFTVLSPVMMAGQWLADRVGHRRSRRQQLAAHDLATRAARACLQAALRAEEATRRAGSPDLAALAQIARMPSARLWERRRGDSDFARLRLGCGDLPARLRVSGPDAPEPVAHDVPLTVSLPAIGVLGIAGPAGRATPLARALVGQLATLHSPRDLSIALLAEPSRAPDWEWIRWLPHARPSDGSGCQALVGLDRDSAAARVAELTALVAARADAGESAGRRAVVVVVDGARALRDTPGLAELLRLGPDGDVLAICLDASDSDLPEECGAVARLTGEVATRVSLRLAGEPTAVEAIADGASLAWAEELARAVAPLVDETVGGRSEALPDSVRWLDLAGFGDTAGSNGEDTCIAGELRERWGRSTGSTTAALLGVDAEGDFVVDIARDGPHALIAGTTGSGKSELLQTLVASLAVANRPGDLNFVLVDYKGGAAFGACAALPHTVGLVTDLDGSLAERALVSLSAELKRRESLLAEAGAVDINGYRAAGRTLARLVLVIDEFATLAEELPDFVGGLVGIAQRGRSLGVHLVLATQRPEGVVSADIRANTNLRICLAAMRDSESRDVIDAPDAARISRTTPGRGYARTGHGELRAFQSGRVGGVAQRADGDAIEVRLAPFRVLGSPPPQPRDRGCGGPENAKTDLDLLVDACREAAARLGIEKPASPWLPPLPEAVVADPAWERPLAAALGVRDLPERQAQEPYIVDLQSMGHLVVAGSARSGRTTSLRTLVGSLARATSTADLHVYAFDCAGGGLTQLAELPHCGAVVAPHEADRARRLMSVVAAEVEMRQNLLAAKGFSSINEIRQSGGPSPPHLLILIDGWESFTSSFDDVAGGAIVDAMFDVLREGEAVGAHVVATADRAGLVGRLASTVENRLVLRLADRGDYALIGMPARSAPTQLPPGRGFLAADLAQTQVCLLSPDPSGPAQRDTLAEIAAFAAKRDVEVPAACRPRRVEELPQRVLLSHVRSLAVASPAPAPASVVLGLGGDELEPVTIDLSASGPGFVVAGPPRSGRTNALTAIASQLRESGWPVLSVIARRSTLGEHTDRSFDANDPGLQGFVAAHEGPLAVIVDDAELVTDSAAARVLDTVMRSARDTGHIVVVAGATEDLSVGFRGFVVDARRSRSGVLLTPRGMLDGEVLGVRLSRDVGGRMPPGRGFLVDRGEVAPLQVALAG